MDGDERMTNILRKALEAASKAYNRTPDGAAREEISYVIGTLEAAIEMIHPDDMELAKPKGWVGKILS